MEDVFAEESAHLSDAYLDLLLSRDTFWAFAACKDGRRVDRSYVTDDA
jgi:hypothetical protein